VANASTYDITTAVNELVQRSFDPIEFPYDILRIYRNTSNTTIAKLKAGDTNPAHAVSGVLLKKYLYYKGCSTDEDPAVVGQALFEDPLTKRNRPRFLLVTNGVDLFAYDTKTGETDNHRFCEEEYWSHFLLPLAPGHDRAPKIDEHPADVKAAKLLGRLYDAILKANPTWTAGNHTDALNHLITRLLFCFYAERTGIFERTDIFATTNIFTETITRYTQEDGSDLGPLLDRLFTIMNVEKVMRPPKLSRIEAAFPYVNGSLFEQTFPVPTFNRFARRQLLDCGNLDWTDINPDIFGSMIQTISDPNERANTGMHYTSVPNIMNVLNPLFLETLNTEYDKAGKSVPRLEALLERIAKIRVFDPACGSGNFIIIAYRELRVLETRILSSIQSLTGNAPLSFVGVSIANFYGIEISPFACETARLSLWIQEHKSNLQLQTNLHIARPTLPLPKIGTIHCANALRVEWLTICPPQDGETFICGNPPYAGAKKQSPDERNDVRATFGHLLDGDTNIDYVGCWFVRLADYLATTSASRGAFVSTTSICQGEQVPFLWPYVFGRGLAISFAHRSFKWANSSAHNAAITCIIVGLAKVPVASACLYMDTYNVTTPAINAYLVPGDQDIIVHSSSTSLNGFPEAVAGGQPKDGGHLMLTPAEKLQLCSSHPEAESIIRPFYSNEDILYDNKRFTLWISDEQLPLARSMPFVVDRLERTRKDRESGGQDKKLVVSTPHRYARNPHKDVPALVIPGVSAEARRYLPISLLGPRDIASITLIVVHSAPRWLLAMLSSRLHLIWATTVGRVILSTIRYSGTLVYNTFPVPDLSETQQLALAQHSKAILKARERHPGKTIASLYDPESMPENLLDVHEANDAYIEQHIYGRSFRDDTHRLEHLFKMYARLKSRADRQQLLFASAKQSDNKKRRG